MNLLHVLRERYEANDRGQTAIEYLGILAVVAAIIAVLLTTDFGTTIAEAIGEQINKVTGGAK